MEYLDIVDRDGNFTGEVVERELAHDRNLLHNEVACMIVNSKREVLLQKRASTKRYKANKLAITAGHVEAGESLDGAMLRELNEELGITIQKEDLHTLRKREILIREENSHITYYYYIVCNLNEEDFKIQEEELTFVKWFNLDEVISMLKSKDEQMAWGPEKVPLFELVRNLEIK